MTMIRPAIVLLRLLLCCASFPVSTTVVSAYQDTMQNDSTPWDYFKVTAIETQRIEIVFRSAVTLTNGTSVFSLSGPNEKTYYAKIGEKILGFEIVRYEPTQGGVKSGPNDEITERNTSVIVLKRGNKILELARGKRVVDNLLVAHVLFIPEDRIAIVAEGESFVAGSREYVVQRISIDQENVELSDPKLRTTQTIHLSKSRISPRSD